jgi:hypothetical protein
MIETTITNSSATQMVGVVRPMRATSRRARAGCELALPTDRIESANVWAVLSLAGTTGFMMPGLHGKLGHRIALLQASRGGVGTRRSAGDDFSLE